MFTSSEQHEWLVDVRENSARAAEIFQEQAVKKLNSSRRYGIVAGILGVGAAFSATPLGMLFISSFFALYAAQDILESRQISKQQKEQENFARSSDEEICEAGREYGTENGLKKRAAVQMNRLKRKLAGYSFSTVSLGAAGVAEAVLAITSPGSGVLIGLAATFFTGFAIWEGSNAWDAKSDVSSWKRAMKGDQNDLSDKLEAAEADRFQSIASMYILHNFMKKGLNVRPAGAPNASNENVNIASSLNTSQARATDTPEPQNPEPQTQILDQSEPTATASPVTTPRIKM